MTENFEAASNAARFDASKSESSSTLSNHAMDLLHNAVFNKNQVAQPANDAIAPAAKVLPDAPAPNISSAQSNDADWRSYHLPENRPLVVTDNKPPQHASQPEFVVKLPEPVQDNSLNARFERIDQALHPRWNGITWSVLPVGQMGPPSSSDPRDKGLYTVQPVVKPRGTILGLSGELAF